MILTIKLNLDHFENQEFQTNEYDNLEGCYREQITFLKGWVNYTEFAQPLIDNILKILGEEGEKSGAKERKAELTASPSRRNPEVNESNQPDSTPLPTTEQVIQDLKGVEPMFETEKALLVVKNSYQKWIPKQYLMETYELGLTADIKLSKGGSWVAKKAWEEYKEMET